MSFLYPAVFCKDTLPLFMRKQEPKTALDFTKAIGILHQKSK